MNYLNKYNQPNKITTKQLRGYWKANKEGLSANDAYNKDTFGIDSLTYKWIKEAIWDLSGICGDTPKLKDINKWLLKANYITDDAGNYLSYYGKKIRY